MTAKQKHLALAKRCAAQRRILEATIRQRHKQISILTRQVDRLGLRVLRHLVKAGAVGTT